MEHTQSSLSKEQHYLHDEAKRLRKRADDLDKAAGLVERAIQTIVFEQNGNGSAPKAKPQRRVRKGKAVKRGRPKGSGQRAKEALKIISANPGVYTISTLGEAMGIKPNYLYRVVPTLPVTKDGEGKLTATI